MNKRIEDEALNEQFERWIPYNLSLKLHQSKIRSSQFLSYEMDIYRAEKTYAIVIYSRRFYYSNANKF